jgi:hypothetical protein
MNISFLFGLVVPVVLVALVELLAPPCGEVALFAPEPFIADLIHLSNFVKSSSM